jgi:hypothetical protein
MQDQNQINSSTNTSLDELKALRLPANYGSTLGVEKLLSIVPVGKPNKGTFFRVRPDEEMTFSCYILDSKDTRETYVVVPNVAQVIGELVRPMMLYAAIDRQNNVSLIPVQLPGENGVRNPWHESLLQAVIRAKTKWIRISANMKLGGYDIYEATAELPEPEWPSRSMDELIEIAFRGKIINSFDHPVVQSLLGKI